MNGDVKLMTKNDTSNLVRRSTLMMPADRPKFIEKAWLRNADAVTLDLEDGVVAEKKEAARIGVKDSIPVIGRGGSDPVVRINNIPGMRTEDLDAAVWPGLVCIAIPKLSSPDEIVEIEETILKLEEKRGITPGSIQTMLSIESAMGYINMKEIIASSTRATSLALGTEDFTRDLGIEIQGGDELMAPKMQTVITACAFGLQPKGLIGSMANYKDLKGLARIAKLSYQHGYRGAGCIHPDQVAVLNECFVPQETDVAYAREVLRVMDKAEKEGKGTASLNGKMIDLPVAVRAKKVVDRMDAINAFEAHKAACRKKYETLSAQH